MPTKVCLVKVMVFPAVVSGCESWTIKKAEHQRIDAFELWYWTVPWTARRSNQSILKETNPEYSLEGLIEAEVLILWPPGMKNWLIGKDLDAGKDWRQEEKGTTEDEMVAWHHHVMVDGPEFEQAPGVGDGQGSLACCSPRGRKESYMTEQLNWTKGYFPTLEFHQRKLKKVLPIIFFVLTLGDIFSLNSTIGWWV